VLLPWWRGLHTYNVVVSSSLRNKGRVVKSGECIGQGCQILFVRFTKTGKNVPNQHTMYQTVIKFRKCS
jgi:hypothetical protein